MASRTRCRSKSRRPATSEPYEGYLVFPRWAETGVGIVGHVESPTLFRERSTEDARDALGALPLVEVQGILDEAIRRSTPSSTTTD